MQDDEFLFYLCLFQVFFICWISMIWPVVLNRVLPVILRLPDVHEREKQDDIVKARVTVNQVVCLSIFYPSHFFPSCLFSHLYLDTRSFYYTFCKYQSGTCSSARSGGGDGGFYVLLNNLSLIFLIFDFFFQNASDYQQLKVVRCRIFGFLGSLL